MERRIYDQQLFAHFVTFGVDRRRQLLDHDHPRRILLGILNEELEVRGGRCVGFVIMPDHFHAVVWFAQTGQLSAFMQQLKRKSSFHIRNWYREHAPHYGADVDETAAFWQAKYHAFEIYGRQKLEEKLTYMHQNPVRAKLVTCTTDWAWSSARWYASMQPVGIPIQWIE